MGLGRAVLFGTLAMIPGALLSLFGWILSGSPEEWSTKLWLSCYAPFFGCVAAGVMIGLKDEGSPDLEV
ncbi:MAG: hypothetical protein ACJZ42_05610 [Candidatus Thalassarchaeaceae archaeon]|nr:MAG: hypothetical protein CND84_04830 [Marine Group II euryarchaeote MED-G35]